MTEDDSYPKDAVKEFIRQFNEYLSAQIKSLLEEKHLYQKVTIEPGKIISEIDKQVRDNRKLVEEQIAFSLGHRLTLSNVALFLVPRGEEDLPQF